NLRTLIFRRWPQDDLERSLARTIIRSRCAAITTRQLTIDVPSRADNHSQERHAQERSREMVTETLCVHFKLMMNDERGSKEESRIQESEFRILRRQPASTDFVLLFS